MASGRLLLPYAEGALQNNLTFASGATLTVYISGGTTLAAIFADSGLVTAITNPQVANAAGAFFEQTTVIWADATQAYDCLLQFPDGESYTFDSIYLLGAQNNTSGFAPINSPGFTGVPTAPTPATNDNSSKLATTAYVQNQSYAPLSSPALTGTPTGPTAAAGTNTTQLATTAFVTGAIAPQSAQFRNQQGSGTASGETLNTGAFRQRVLNTVVFNGIPGASLASNQVTLEAGTYLVQAFACALATTTNSAFTHKIRVYDATASTTLVAGLNASISATTGGANNLSVVGMAMGQFTLGASHAVEVDSWVGGSAASGGTTVTSGDPEVYVDVLFTLLP